MSRKIILVGLLLTIIFAVHAHADYAADTATYITTSNLNLRTGPGTGYTRLTTVQAGTQVTVTDRRDGTWFAVIVGERTGYMYAQWLAELAATAHTSGTLELVQWSEARDIVTRGYIFTVIDVRTGLSWEMASFSIGSHADVETITAADTATMRQAFGGSWTWTPRPVVVVARGRALAASINGMPHAGWTRSGNNMNGHVCLHFQGSLTHNRTISHERDHQAAVLEAFRYGARWLGTPTDYATE